jgi:hypothetical protein
MIKPWEDLMELPSLAPVVPNGLNALRAQHSLTPFSTGVLVTAPGPMLYMFADDEMIGTIDPQMAYAFGAQA